MGFSSGNKPTGILTQTSADNVENKTLDASNTITGTPISGSTITGASIESPTRTDVKSVADITAAETYASTATNGQLIFATAEKKMFQVIDSALAEVGGGAANINYITNPDLEVNLNDYTGDTNLTLVALEPGIRGTRSLQIDKGAIDASTQSVTTNFTVDTADLAQMLTIQFDYDASHFNYADGHAQVRIIKDPLGTPTTIRVNGEDIKAGKGTHIAQFQTDATETSYALEIYWDDATTVATELIIDNVQVGPREVVKGAAMTDMIDFTPTGTWTTNTTYTGKYRRVGDSMEVSVVVDLSGAPNATSLIVDIPNGLSIDTSKINSTTSSSTLLGNANIFDQTSDQAGVVKYQTSTSVGVYGMRTGSSDAHRLRAITQIEPFTFGASDKVKLHFTVPIKGWSSNAILSEDIGNRDIYASGRENDGTTMTASVDDINWTVDKDTTGSFNGTQYTIPETGVYNFSGALRLSSSTTTNIKLYLDTGSGPVFHSQLGENSISNVVKPFNATDLFNKGDIISFRCSVTSTLFSQDTSHFIHIQKLATPQTILDTATVAARYTSSDGSTLPLGIDQVIKFEELVMDTHSAYNVSTGIYTVPVNGIYDITAFATLVSLTSNTGRFELNILLNGNKETGVFDFHGNGSVAPRNAHLKSISLSKGDEISVEGWQNNSADRPISGLSYRNSFSIARIK